MDLRLYYQKIRETEAKLAADDVVVVSYDTPDGGKAGVQTQMPRTLAAKLIVDGYAHEASPEETKLFLKKQAESKRLADQQAECAKLHLSVMSSEELAKLKSITTPKE